MKNLRISSDVQTKLTHKHGVSRKEVEQCFFNRTGRLLEDIRARHKTNPPTLWFLAPTNQGRVLKVVYIQNGTHINIRSAFEPSDVERDIYARKG